jgi:hypothetical protein
MNPEELLEEMAKAVWENIFPSTKWEDADRVAPITKLDLIEGTGKALRTFVERTARIRPVGLARAEHFDPQEVIDLLLALTTNERGEG